MTSKVKIKAGVIEVEFEGSEEYMKNELPTLIELLYSLSPSTLDEDINAVDVDELLISTNNTSKEKLQMTTNTIASKLNVKKANDLVIAACAHLVFVKGQDTFTRANILAEMKLASNYYKQTMRKNLSNILKTLLNQNKLLETSKDTYALDASVKSQLEKQLYGN